MTAGGAVFVSYERFCHEKAYLVALYPQRRAIRHSIERAQVGEVPVGNAFRDRSAIWRQHVRNAGKLLAGVKRCGLRERQQGDVIGQRTDFIVGELAGLCHDQDVVETAGQAIVHA